MIWREMINKRSFIGYVADIKKDVARGSTEPTKVRLNPKMPEGRIRLGLSKY
jgi:hypothetical protein